MSTPVYTRRPAETLGSGALAELALDRRWSFNHAADTIWQQLDPVFWNLTHAEWTPAYALLVTCMPPERTAYSDSSEFSAALTASAEVPL